MTIDRHNIEAYLLDYYEGRMDPVLSAELMAFLAENPEYDFILPESGPLVSGGDHFEDTARLKRDFGDIPEINDANFEEFCIASAEGILSPADIRRLETWLEENPDMLPVYLLYERLKLQPDMTVVYSGKSLLKRGGGQTILVRSAWALLGLAASFAVFMLLYRPSPVPVPVNTSSVIQQLPETPASETRAMPQQVVPIITTVQSPATPDPVMAAALPAGQHVALEPMPMRDALISLADHTPGLSIQQRPSATSQTEIQLASSGLPGHESLLPAVVDLLFRKVSLWKAAETAVTGFNYLTESQVAISRTVDDSGRPVALTLDTEQFMIRGNKLK
jgi:hypothetical protein